MAKPTPHKKTNVKHKTRRGGHLGGDGSRSGFKVGPKHAPDGAYLGKVKRIKADLIAKAKVKKRFFKSGLAGPSSRRSGDGEAEVDQTHKSEDEISGLEDSDEPTSSRRPRTSVRAAESFTPFPYKVPEAEGRFKSEREEADETMSSTGRHPSQRGESASATRGRGRGRGRGGDQDDNSRGRGRGRGHFRPETSAQPPAPPAHTQTAEERLALRKERNEMWQRPSGSARGSSRGQPDLGARMEVLLGKIRESQK